MRGPTRRRAAECADLPSGQGEAQGGRAAGDEIPEGVGGVVAADAVVIGVDFEDVFRAIGIVLQGREARGQPCAAPMYE